MLYHIKSYRITNREKCKAFMSEYENPFGALGACCISVFLHPHCAGVDAHTVYFCESCSSLLPNGYMKTIFDARTLMDCIYRATMRDTNQTHTAKQI